MKNTTRTLSLIAAVSSAVLLAACGGGGSSAGGSGTLGVAMTDAPACGFDAVNVTVTKVRVHQSSTASDTDAGWTDITLNPARKINLLNLTNGVLEDLGQTPLSAGHYTQLRLVLDSNASGTANTVTPTGGVETPLDTPSAVQSGIKLINDFDVTAGQLTDLTLDFNACKSIVTKGNSGGYLLKPVIQVIPTTVDGISGTIDTAVLGQHVMISAEQNGEVIRSTTPSSTGSFLLSNLAAGNYDVVITSDSSATEVISAVPVDGTHVVPISTSAAPITLQSGGSARTIGGTLTVAGGTMPDDALVSTQQTFSNGPTVTVRFQVPSTTGAYSITNMPTAAPYLAKYSTTLPLTFTQQTTTTPGTGKYVVKAEAGGVEKTQTIDVTTADQTSVNFAF